jgi:hypothetical protein
MLISTRPTLTTAALLPGARMRTSPEQAMRAVYKMRSRAATVAPEHAELYRRLLCRVMTAATDALDGDRGGLARMHQRLRAAIVIKAGRVHHVRTRP